MINEQTTTTCTYHGYKKCLSWSAVVVGALVGVGLNFLLNLFGIGIGLTIFKTTPDNSVMLAVGGAIGFAIGAFATMFVAGWTAGYLGRPYCLKRNLGTLYGFTTWCLVLILTVLLSSSVGKFVTVYSGYINTQHVAMIHLIKRPETVAVTSVTPVVAADVETTANDMGKAGLALFGLFFIGAFASCVGGHCGMSCKKDDYYCESDKPRI